ncbi:hypothetical protein GCM10023350_06330 [Nocardioides endophyticus]|uniref:Uncharacterized protein n=1 Tax=Nocardioides endophyticus TaxID=1353775 RepID=A0ABP8YH59_9ACTN
MTTMTPREESFAWASANRARRGLGPVTDAEHEEWRRKNYATGPEAEAQARIVAERLGVHWTEVRVAKPRRADLKRLGVPEE